MFMNNSNEQNEVVYLYLDDIIPNRFQPRERFDEGALRELAASIKEHGVIQPIIVRKIGDKYEIIAGERRYKASALAGLTKIPAIIRNLDDKETSKVALLENLQRKNLSAIEEARTYQKILDLDQMTQFELAKTMGKSQPVVANKLRLLTLPDEVQEALLKEQISERHARSLLALPTSEEQIEMLHKIINNRMTVRETDEEVRKRTTTDNFELPGLEATSAAKDTNDVESKEINPMEVSMPKPTEINIQPSPMPNVDVSVPSNDSNQNVVDTPDVNSLRTQAVDISSFNPTIEQTNIEKPSSVEPSVEQSTLDSTQEEDKSKNFIDLEELLRDTKEVPIKEVPLEKPVENIENNPVKEETEELLEKIETGNEETLDIEELNAPDEKETTSPAVEEKKEVTTPHEKPLPSVVDNPSINVFDLRLAISDIRDKVAELQNKGIKIDSEEIDFEKQYQIIIKIEK